MNTTYNYKILNDPMKTTDPDFFGLWNQKSQMWENHGILDYDKYSNSNNKPDLFNVSVTDWANKFDLK